MVLQNSKFLKNKSVFFSNCIFFQGSSLIISESEFTLNIPNLNEDNIRYHNRGFGGAIQFLGAHLSLKDTYFLGNTNLFGGVLFVAANDAHNLIDIEIIGGFFINNMENQFG